MVYGIEYGIEWGNHVTKILYYRRIVAIFVSCFHWNRVFKIVAIKEEDWLYIET